MASNDKPFVIVLSEDKDGPVYLGQIDRATHRQGVRRVENATRYKTRGQAGRVARDYEGARVEYSAPWLHGLVPTNPHIAPLRTWKVSTTEQGVVLTINGISFALGTSRHALIEGLRHAVAEKD